MCCDSGRNHTLADVTDIRQPEMLGGSYVTEEIGAGGRCNRTTDRASNMVVARGDIAGQRPKYVERGAGANSLLQLYVRFDLIQRYMAGTFDHHLDPISAGALG